MWCRRAYGEYLLGLTKGIPPLTFSSIECRRTGLLLPEAVKGESLPSVVNPAAVRAPWRITYQVPHNDTPNPPFSTVGVEPCVRK